MYHNFFPLDTRKGACSRQIKAGGLTPPLLFEKDLGQKPQSKNEIGGGKPPISSISLVTLENWRNGDELVAMNLWYLSPLLVLCLWLSFVTPLCYIDFILLHYFFLYFDFVIFSFLSFLFASILLFILILNFLKIFIFYSHKIYKVSKNLTICTNFLVFCHRTNIYLLTFPKK